MKGPYKPETIAFNSRPSSACTLHSLLILTPRTRLRLNLKAKGLVPGPVCGEKEVSPTVPRLRLQRPVTRFSLYLQRGRVSRGMYWRDTQTARPSLTRHGTFREKNLGETQRPASVGGIRQHCDQSSPTRFPVPKVRVAVNPFSSSDTPAPWTPNND